MSIQLHAEPYDLDATGFYFSTADEYADKVQKCRNAFGQPVEEFEIQFIDGDSIDADLAEAWKINQDNFDRFLSVAEDWDEHEKIAFIIAVGECGYDFDPKTVTPHDFEVDIYQVDTLKELAEQFVDEGIFGDIPDHLANYIDYDAIARDLQCDYSTTVIDGQRLAYRCA